MYRNFSILKDSLIATALQIMNSLNASKEMQHFIQLNELQAVPTVRSGPAIKDWATGHNHHRQM